MKRLAALLITVVVLASFVAACAPATPEVIEKEVIVEKEVPVTVEVEKEKIVEKKVVETVEVEKVVEIVVTPTPLPEKPKASTVGAPPSDGNVISIRFISVPPASSVLSFHLLMRPTY